MISREYCANKALAASVIQRGPRINAASRRAMRRDRRRESISNAAGGAAFLFLFAACFFPFFL